ncbi:MAG: ATP-binding protein [Flavobacteriales bacterium]|nr:ATP-binding protein [Flavobacteriales bacterium]
MEKLFQRFTLKMRMITQDFHRYLYHEINWDDRLIAIKGARGVGKTTLILQYIQENLPLDEQTLYVSLDDIYFQANSLVDLAEEFYVGGGKYLFLDEVHKYANWSIEIKNIYDTYGDLKIVFTSSSVLEINRGNADLSRRAVAYDLEGLSFREYVNFQTGCDFSALSLEEILKNHVKVSQDISSQIKIFPLFKKYLHSGYYPFYREGESSYLIKLNSIVGLTLETDIPSMFNTEYKTIYKLKKLLYIIASSLPYQPNITELSKNLDTSSRTSTLQYLDYLEKAKLTANLRTGAKGKNMLMKPDKIFLDNTNLMYAIIGEENLNVGNVRETLFFNLLRGKHKVNSSQYGDFMINDKYVFEIGGKGKKITQVKDVSNSYVVADDIEVGFGTKIPLWLFGFIY